MVILQEEAHFKQLPHCNFRENIVKFLHIPNLNFPTDTTTELDNIAVAGKVIPTTKYLFLIVNKYGKIGIYDPTTFKLVHSYILDLTVPMYPQMSKCLQLFAKRNQQMPKCSKTHLIVDAVYCSRFKSCLFLTTKGILQCYDIGEIEHQSIGLDLLPRKEFIGIKHGQQILPIKNFGHVETHRLYGLYKFPTCIEIVNNEIEQEGQSKLLIGDSNGCITIINLDSECTGYLFGKRKIRGICHEIIAMDLFHAKLLTVYKGHNGPVSQVLLLKPRQVIVSCSSIDRKFSLFANDLLVESCQPKVISLRKGINTFAHSIQLKMLVTGSDDCILRLFNDFISNIPQMELAGHNSPIIAVEFLNVSFSKTQILISFSKDVELRVWDVTNFTCLQSIYISFLPKSIIMCKTPEFAKKCLYIYQPQYNGGDDDQIHIKQIKTPEPNQFNENDDVEKVYPQNISSSAKTLNNKEGNSLSSIESQDHDDGKIIVFYCNSYTTLTIKKDATNWPFDFDNFIEEFEEANIKHEQKLESRRLQQQQSVMDPSISARKNLLGRKRQSEDQLKRTSLSQEELALIETNLDKITQDILTEKKLIDKKLGILRSYEFETNHEKSHKEECFHANNSTNNTGQVPQSLLEVETDLQKKYIRRFGNISPATTTAPSKMSLSTQAMRKFHSLERAKSSSSKHDFINQAVTDSFGKISNQNKPMPVTDSMKQAGIKNIASIQDLLTDKAKEYFAEENMQKVKSELELMEKTLKSEVEFTEDKLEEEIEEVYAGADKDESLSSKWSAITTDESRRSRAESCFSLKGILSRKSSGSSDSSSKLMMESDFMTSLAQDKFGDDYAEELSRDLESLLGPS